MKNIIVSATEDIRVEDLTGREIVAYRSHNSENYCVLAKLTQVANVQMYGFVPLNGFDQSPRFMGLSPKDSIEKCFKKGRKAVAFSNMKEMLTAMLNKSF